MSDLINRAISALQNGEAMPTSGDTPAPSTDAPETDVAESAASEGEQPQGVEETTLEGASDLQAEGEEGESEAEQPEADIEKMEVTGPNGKKVPIEVNWNDRESLKKYIHQAAGMRHFQRERDTVKSQIAELQKQHADISQSWQAVTKSFQTGGIKGLVELLAGEQGAYDKHLEQAIQEKNAWEAASPAERDALTYQRQLEAERAERKLLQDQLKAQSDKVQQNLETAERKQLESLIHPAFSKHRLQGKLGDSAAEARLDKVIWADTMEALAKLPDSVELTPELVEEQFSKVAGELSSLVNKQVATKTTQAIKQKKATAIESAAAAVTKGKPLDAEQAAFTKDIRSGNIIDAFKRFTSGNIKI